MLGECCSEHGVIEMVRGEGSEGPLLAVCYSSCSGRIESVEGDSFIENSRQFVSVSSPRWPVLNPRILCGVDFPSSISSSSTFHHSDDQRHLVATVPRGSAVLSFDSRSPNYVTKQTICKERYVVTSLYLSRLLTEY